MLRGLPSSGVEANWSSEGSASAPVVGDPATALSASTGCSSYVPSARFSSTRMQMQELKFRRLFQQHLQALAQKLVAKLTEKVWRFKLQSIEKKTKGRIWRNL